MQPSVVFLYAVGCLCLSLRAFGDDLVTASKRIVFVDGPDLLASDKALPSGSRLKLALVYTRDAARTPLTDRYLEKATNWTQCGSTKQLPPLKLVTEGGEPSVRKPPHEHHALPGGCRMGVVTEEGLKQARRGGGMQARQARPWPFLPVPAYSGSTGTCSIIV